MPGPPGKFRSFVQDMKTDFPTMDQFTQQQVTKQVKKQQDKSRSPAKKKLGALLTQSFQITEDNAEDLLEAKRIKIQYAKELEE